MLQSQKMSFKKSEKKSKDVKKQRMWPPGSQISPPSAGGLAASGGATGAALPEGAKTRLWELFGQIELEFQQLHSENAAREPLCVCVCVCVCGVHSFDVLVLRVFIITQHVYM